MSKITNFLGLFKWDTGNTSDLNEQFNLEKSMNENWDKIEEAIEENQTNINNLEENKANLADVYSKTDIDASLNNKVDKEAGKVLSSNDYTDEDKAKLEASASKEYVSTRIGRMRVEEMTTGEATILPNVYYVWGEVAELTITLGDFTNDGYTDEYCFEFVSGEVATTLIMDEGIKWVLELNIEANKKYQVSILNGIGVIAGA